MWMRSQKRALRAARARDSLYMTALSVYALPGHRAEASASGTTTGADAQSKPRKGKSDTGVIDRAPARCRCPGGRSVLSL